VVLELRTGESALGRDLGKPLGSATLITFRIPRVLLGEIRIDLRRPHAFASERVGFVVAHPARLRDKGIVALAFDYLPVPDDGYEDDPTVGAMMNSSAIRMALQYAYNHQVAVFHVHLHEHSGRPEFSPVDRHEHARFVPNFSNVALNQPHGALVLSSDSAAGRCWPKKGEPPVRITKIVVVGAPLVILR